MGTLDLNAVVGIYVLIIPLFTLNWPCDQSGLYLLMYMAAPIHGSSLEETIKRLSLCFTNCDNQPNEIAICHNTYSLELLHFTSLQLTLLYCTLLFLHLFYTLHFIFSIPSFIAKITSHTHYRS